MDYYLLDAKNMTAREIKILDTEFRDIDTLEDMGEQLSERLEIERAQKEAGQEGKAEWELLFKK